MQSGYYGNQTGLTRFHVVCWAQMKDLEEKKTDADNRAETAEQKLRLMEQQLAAIHWQPRDLETRVHDLQRECHEKNRIIKSLQEQLDEQKRQRQQDAKQVESKAGKIKDWVTNKLSQLEQQNQALQTENEMLQDQVEILRERLQALPAFAAKEIYRLSGQDSFSRPTSSVVEESRPESQNMGSRTASEMTNLSGLLGSRPVSEVSSRPASHNFGSRPMSEVVGIIRPFSGTGWSETVSEVVNLQPFSRTYSSRPTVEFESTSQPGSGYSSRSASPGVLPPEIPRRPSPSILEAFKMEQELMEDRTDASISPPSDSPDSSPDGLTENLSDNNSDDSMADIEHDPLYQEVDQNHESTYEPKKTLPPQIKIERKQFHDPHIFDSLVSSSTGSEEVLSRLRNLQNGDMNRDEEDDTLRLEDEDVEEEEEEEKIIVEDVTPITLTPSTMMTPLTPLTPLLPQASPSMTGVFGHHHTSNVSAIATFPRVRKERDKPPPLQLLAPKEGPQFFLAQETQRGRGQFGPPPPVLEPQVIGREMCKNRSSPMTTRRAAAHTHWEKRSYAVPKKSRQQPTDQHALASRSPGHEVTALDQLYQDLSVPVFATLKGKAAQIRSTPFTGESSSESSDNEEGPLPSGIIDQSDLSASAASPITDRNISKQQQSSSGATKRGVSCHSAASETSCDYADPPDETSSKSDSENSEPEQKLLKYATDNQKHDTLEKFGYLSKLGGKVKMWKRRWFVLRNGDLIYYKSQHDVLRKPQGTLKLDEQTRISHVKGELTFEITNSKRTYYFTADSQAETEKWIKILRKFLKRQATSYLLDHMETKAVVRGWLTKVKHGATRKCWCVLLGHYFLYYRTAKDKTPIGQINLQSAKIEDVDNSGDSDEECEVTMTPKHVVAVWPPNQGPTYLIVPSKHEKDSWLYHLTVAAGGGMGNVGTEYEQLIAKVIEVEGDNNSVYWKHPMMLHCKEPITKPLTTLPSEDLERKAAEMFKWIVQFIYCQIDTSKLDFHVELAQSILELCVSHPQLQNELYCQLIKQTTPHPIQHKTTMQNLLLCGKHSWYLCHATPTSPTNSVVDLSDSKMNPAHHVFLQGWQLLAMCVSLFLPKQSIMWHLKVHLQRNTDQKSEIGKYAIFCQRALERTVVKGIREVRPSRMEVMSILLRHPFHHSQPISIPVHFLHNTYQVVSFDGSTTVQEFLLTLSKAICVRDVSQSGFSLCTDDPCSSDIEHCLQSSIKICDVISKWEQSHREYVSGKHDNGRTIRLLYKNRLYFKSSSSAETEKEKLLLTYQVNDEIINGRFPLNKDLALELASLMAQIEFGDVKLSTESSQVGGAAPPYQPNLAQQLTTVLDRFYPRKYSHATEEEQRSTVSKLLERWVSLRGRSPQDCVRVYLAVVRKWPFCGAKLFFTKVKTSPSPEDEVWLAVQEEGISILEHSTMQPISSYDFRSVITFGGWKDDFMLVVTQLIESAPHHYEHRTEKLLFSMPKHKVLEATLLVASYINVRVQHPSQDSSADL
ncbi:pleckstrin homology domain-containing family H member 1-like isoform X2 [Argopecten irradians]|uniref:pleckstrin homology domain-containing family H member 1-like isoform X2 n=1 Tax=Argopecten irradians TaxID=31199 RepID=UPI0037104CF4